MRGPTTHWQLRLRVDGKELDERYFKTVSQVRVLQDIASPGSVALSIAAPREEVLAWLDDAGVDEGSTVAVEMGDSDRRDLVFAGEITGLDIAFSGKLAVTLSLRGYDGRHRMMRARLSKNYENIKDSDIARQIGQAHGLHVEAVATSPAHKTLSRGLMNDLEFLKLRASEIGYEVLVIGETLHFRPCQHKAAPVKTLSAGRDLLDFHAAVTSMNMPTEVAVRAWDVINKKAIVGKADSSALGRGSGPARAKTFGAAVVIDGGHPVASQAEAEKLAAAQLLELALSHVTAEASLHGDSSLAAGSVVELTEVGARFSGNYYITSASHDFTLAGSRRYETHLTLRRAAS
jgi:uncharacterized protein